MIVGLELCTIVVEVRTHGVTVARDRHIGKRTIVRISTVDGRHRYRIEGRFTDLIVSKGLFGVFHAIFVPPGTNFIFARRSFFWLRRWSGLLLARNLRGCIAICWANNNGHSTDTDDDRRSHGDEDGHNSMTSKNSDQRMVHMEQMRDMPEGMAHRPNHSMEKSKEHQLPSSFRNSMWVKCTAAALQQCERDMEGGKLMGGILHSRRIQKTQV